MVYCGASFGGGVAKSTNGASSWSPVVGPLDLDVEAVAVDSVTPSTLYAGTVFTGGPSNLGGVYKSTDSGGVWAAVNSGLGVPTIHALVVDPVTPTTLYAATDYISSGGVSKSTNGGASWVPSSTGLPNVYVRALAIDPVTPTILYAATSAGIFKTTNGANNWTGPHTSAAWSLVVDPALGQLYRTTNAGGIWAPASLGRPVHFNALAVSATTPGTLYGGGVDVGVLLSVDFGATWTPVNRGLGTSAVHALALDPSGATLYGGFAAGAVWRLRPTTGAFHTLTPCRVLDTRAADGPALAAGSIRTFKLVGRCGIPSTASSVSLNITVTEPSGPGHLRLLPGNTALPSSSSMNFDTGQTRANNAVSLLGAAGDLAVFSGQAAGSLHVVVDANGYFQ